MRMHVHAHARTHIEMRARMPIKVQPFHSFPSFFLPCKTHQWQRPRAKASEPSVRKCATERQKQPQRSCSLLGLQDQESDTLEVVLKVVVCVCVYKFNCDLETFSEAVKFSKAPRRAASCSRVSDRSWCWSVPVLEDVLTTQAGGY